LMMIIELFEVEEMEEMMEKVAMTIIVLKK
jgi:hypothetical protein